ncbi:hypothetical protein TCAL_09116 [Tigriopus californicus]|uniref:Uncharacterized protein n=2 Tax=Tigriopus californicus TaxID=6832 RepID=A0A553P8C3_TIGCA|nr:uncharacterized protein LOC131878499 isoform X2 [Tigriopus californicus]TRY73919.1 hypothetical protein TCAL_09116 [Tigriopus californicus]|eukprot:TCALIF_09116-PA protein Name:"Protein of unknown function" AED:0.00 eAED:0.00 QI:199/1/1/1/0.5/0.66/3/95/532
MATNPHFTNRDRPTLLPPMPKLRRKPGFELEDREAKPEPEEVTTSRLLMKNECRGSGRKKSNGSLVHSIPKFTQVKPNERLSEVQKVLQNRIRLKQQRKRLEQEQQEIQSFSHHIDQQRQQNSRNPVLLSDRHRIPVSVPGLSGVEIKLVPSSASVASSQSNLPAASLLQNIMSFHEKREERITKPLSRSNESGSKSAGHKRRGRKPAKDEICHFVSSRSSPKAFRPIVPLPQLSEVTITPTLVTRPSANDRTTISREEALDLRKTGRAKSQTPPEILEVDVDPEQMIFEDRQSPLPMMMPPVLSPMDFESLGAPPGYVFEPRSAVFVHPSALHLGLPGLLPHHFPPLGHLRSLPGTTSPSSLPSSQALSITPINSKEFSHLEAMQSMQSVMRYKPNRVFREAGVPLEPHCPQSSSAPPRVKKKKVRPTTSDGSQEVSICKFKFTGGDRPSLEEKKMLSVDSTGNFKYFSGSGERTMRGSESMPMELIHTNSRIITDKFTSLTAEKIALANSEKNSHLVNSSEGHSPHISIG